MCGSVRCPHGIGAFQLLLQIPFPNSMGWAELDVAVVVKKQ